MIIVSQSKKMVVNFEISQILEVNTPEAWGQGFYSIDTYPNTEDSQKFHIRLGKYDTEERAKEVLQEIVKVFSSYLQLNGGPAILQGQIDIQPNIFNIPKVYEMPKE